MHKAVTLQKRGAMLSDTVAITAAGLAFSFKSRRGEEKVSFIFMNSDGVNPEF